MIALVVQWIGRELPKLAIAVRVGSRAQKIITMKNQKGFIQIPILIVIIVGVVVIGGISYLGVRQYKNNQAVQKSSEIQTPQQENKESTTSANSEIEKLKQEVEELRAGFLKTQETPKQAQDNTDVINASNIESFLFYVGQVGCIGTSGSSNGTGVLVNVSGSVKVLTNRHVITGTICTFKFTDKTYGFKNYGLDIKNPLAWNTITDSVVVSLKSFTKDGDLFSVSPLSLLNQLTSPIKTNYSCRERMPLGSPVVVIGYPVTTQYISGKLEIPSYGITIDRTENPQTVITGIISAYDESVLRNLPDVNYFTTAPMDSGNSGGLALSKIGGKICILGIPTWAAVGNFQNQGVIQSFNNIFFTP